MDELKRKAVERMLCYIEHHLQEPVSMQQLADAARYSAWHAQRMFKEMTGCSPFAYLRSRRLAEAAHRLGQGDVRVIDVAFDFMFDSHEGFTRAFTKQLGMNPSAFRKALATYQNRTLTSRETSEETMQTVFVQVIDRPQRKLLVKFAQKATDYYTYCEEVGCELWDKLAAVQGALFEPIGMWMPPKFRRQGSGEYCQGVEVPLDFSAPIPKGLEVITLPACKMMVFQGPPYDDEHYEEAITNIWEVMKTYDPTLYGFLWADEDGPRYQLAPMGWRGYIEARPVQQLNKE